MKSLRPGPAATAGFTLIELMIVTAIIGIAMTPMLGMFLSARKFSDDHLLFTRAAAALARQSEILKSTPYSALALGQGQSLDAEVAASLQKVPGFGGGIDISSLDRRPGIKKIVIQVTWENPWGTRKSLHTTLLRSAP